MVSEDRITRIETEMSWIKAAFSEVRTALTQLAEDMHKMALAEARREEDRRTLERVFRRLEEVDEEFVRLWKRTDDIVDMQTKFERDRLKEQVRDGNKWIWEIARSVFTVIAALILFQFGVK